MKVSEIYFARWRCEKTSHFIKQAYHLEGFGKIFAEGVKKAAEILGGGASKYVIHVKGAGYNMHDWRTA